MLLWAEHWRHNPKKNGRSNTWPRTRWLAIIKCEWCKSELINLITFFSLWQPSKSLNYVDCAFVYIWFFMMNVCCRFIFFAELEHLTFTRLGVLYSNWMNQLTCLPVSISRCDNALAWLINLNYGCVFNALYHLQQCELSYFSVATRKVDTGEKRLENKKKKKEMM